ncbi:MAG: hypothetical protein ACP5P4_09755 [Steroidobacteraceae bacterium]
MSQKQSAPENRLTLVQIETLMRLASQMSIEIKPVVRGREFELELSGDGFSKPDPVVLPLSDAYARLLSEVCGGLAPWLQFSPAEPCDVTLFALSEDALNATIRKFQYRLAMRFVEKRRDERRISRRMFSSDGNPPAQSAVRPVSAAAG